MNHRNLISSFAIGFSLLFSYPLLAQQIDTVDSIDMISLNRQKSVPQLHYSVGSSFTYMPRFGSMTGINFTPSLRYPLTPKISVEAGLIAGRYYPAFKNMSEPDGRNSAFNALSVYGSANYQFNKRLSVYGTGIKQLGNGIPMYNMPASSFSIGSTLDFGNFSIGAEIRMSDWNNNFSPYPYSGTQNLFPVYPW